VQLQFLANRENLLDQTCRSFPPDPLGRTTFVLKTVPSFCSKPTEPFREPKPTPVHSLENPAESESLFVKLDGFNSNLIFPLFPHRPLFSSVFGEL
jgi:hypothetical protein